MNIQNQTINSKFVFLWLCMFSVLFISSGCTIFNPYSSKVQCEGTDKGKCMSVTEAYNERNETTTNDPTAQNKLKKRELKAAAKI